MYWKYRNVGLCIRENIACILVRVSSLWIFPELIIVSWWWDWLIAQMMRFHATYNIHAASGLFQYIMGVDLSLVSSVPEEIVWSIRYCLLISVGPFSIHRNIQPKSIHLLWSRCATPSFGSDSILWTKSTWVWEDVERTNISQWAGNNREIFLVGRNSW